MTSKNNQPGDAAPSADTTGSLQADSLRLSSGQALRRQAEAKLSEQKKKAAALPAPETDTQRLVHELEVHQIELEMQNEELVQSRTQVEAGLHKYTDLYDFAPVGYFTLALDGAIHQVNLAGANLLGAERGALIKRRFGVFVSARSRTTFSAFLEKVFSRSWSEETCEIALQKDGSAPLWVHIEAMTEDVQRKTCRVVVVDITERKQAEEALRVSEENFHQSLEDSPLGVRIVSEEGETLYVNRATLDIFGCDSIEEWQTTPSVKRYTEQSYAAFKVRREKRRLGEDDSSEYGIDIVRKDGEVRHLQVWRKRVLWNGKEHYQVIYRDITDRKRTEKALEESEKRYRELSIADDLTQLYNSRYFYHQLKMEMDRADRYGQPLTLLLLDLDDFKRFNDAYGHVEGDQVLWRFGQVVKRCLRQTDSAYRYGGEEFTILLPMTTSADGAVTAERIRTEFKKETFSPAPGQDVHVTVSIGLAQYKMKEEMKVFVHRVDQLMYQGKKSGKDRVCCES